MAFIIIIAIAAACAVGVHSLLLARFPEVATGKVAGSSSRNARRRQTTAGIIGAADRISDLRPLKGTEADDYRIRLARAGLSMEPTAWRGLEILMLVVCVALGVALGFNIGGSGGIILAAVCIAIGFALPRFLLWSCARDRRRNIESNIASTLELLSVTVKSGYPIERGIRLIGQNTEGPLAEEFRRTDNDINLAGMSVERALKAMAERCGCPAVTAFCTALVQALQQGTSVSRVLDSQARIARNEHYARLKEQINKLPAKLVAPIFGIMMLIIVIALVPPIYNTVQTFMDVYGNAAVGDVQFFQ